MQTPSPAAISQTAQPDPALVALAQAASPALEILKAIVDHDGQNISPARLDAAVVAIEEADQSLKTVCIPSPAMAVQTKALINGEGIEVARHNEVILPGQWWEAQQGHYAGIMPALNGQPAYHLILDKDDLLAAGGSAAHEWGQYGKKIEGADSLSDGLTNTKALVAANQALVASMGSAPSAHLSTGASAAYIPSKREMALIVATCSEHMTAGELYWTSSQCSAGLAWFQSFGNGLSHWFLKDTTLRVRPVRRLSL